MSESNPEEMKTINTSPELVETFHEDGKTPELRYHILDDKLEGLFEKFDENGECILKAQYKKNKLNGLFQMFELEPLFMNQCIQTAY